MDSLISLESIMDYGFYDESHRYIVKLNKDKLQELFNADDIIFKETYN